MWSGAWNKRKLPSEISNGFLPSSVVRAPDWWSRGCEFKPQWWQFLTKFILSCVTLDLSDNLTKKRNVKNSSERTLCITFVMILHHLSLPVADPGCVRRRVTTYYSANFFQKITPKWKTKLDPGMFLLHRSQNTPVISFSSELQVGNNVNFNGARVRLRFYENTEMIR